MEIRGIVISPYSKTLRNGKINPKNYPYWKELMVLLRKEGIETVQFGPIGEEPIGADKFLQNLPFDELQKLIKMYKTWISVDNFMGHFCHYYKKPGIVIFGQSDPLIFGYPENENILKDRRYLRYNQYAIWEEAEYNEDAFPKPEEIIPIIRSKVNHDN